MSLITHLTLLSETSYNLPTSGINSNLFPVKLSQGLWLLPAFAEKLLEIQDILRCTIFQNMNRNCSLSDEIDVYVEL